MNSYLWLLLAILGVTQPVMTLLLNNITRSMGNVSYAEYVCTHLNPCFHEAPCTAENKITWMCECDQYYAGARCQFKNPCHADFCKNDGICYADDLGNPGCRCPDQYTGSVCEYRNRCFDDIKCHNDGVCQVIPNRDGEWMCLCSEQWSGTYCNETKYDNCLPLFTLKSGELYLYETKKCLKDPFCRIVFFVTSFFMGSVLLGIIFVLMRNAWRRRVLKLERRKHLRREYRHRRRLEAFHEFQEQQQRAKFKGCGDATAYHDNRGSSRAHLSIDSDPTNHPRYPMVSPMNNNAQIELAKNFSVDELTYYDTPPLNKDQLLLGGWTDSVPGTSNLQAYNSVSTTSKRGFMYAAPYDYIDKQIYPLSESSTTTFV